MAHPWSDPCGYHWLLPVSRPVCFPSFTFTLLGHRVVTCFHLLTLLALSQACDLMQLFLDWEDYVRYRLYQSTNNLFFLWKSPTSWQRYYLLCLLMPANNWLFFLLHTLNLMPSYYWKITIVTLLDAILFIICSCSTCSLVHQYGNP